MTKLPTCSRGRCNKPPTVFPWCWRHARTEADDLFSRYVRHRDRRCQSCGDPTNLQCAHIVSRRYYATRWADAVALCAGCHYRYTNDPLAWDRWCVERFGRDGYDDIRRRAEMGGMPDIAYVIAELRTALAEVTVGG